MSFHTRETGQHLLRYQADLWSRRPAKSETCPPMTWSDAGPARRRYVRCLRLIFRLSTDPRMSTPKISKGKPTTSPVAFSGSSKTMRGLSEPALGSLPKTMRGLCDPYSVPCLSVPVLQLCSGNACRQRHERYQNGVGCEANYEPSDYLGEIGWFSARQGLTVIHWPKEHALVREDVLVLGGLIVLHVPT